MPVGREGAADEPGLSILHLCWDKCYYRLFALHLQSHLTLPQLPFRGERWGSGLMGGNWWRWDLPHQSHFKTWAINIVLPLEGPWRGSPICSCKFPFWPPQTKVVHEGPRELTQVNQEFTLQNHDSHRKELKRGWLLFLSLFLLTEFPQFQLPLSSLPILHSLDINYLFADGSKIHP